MSMVAETKHEVNITANDLQTPLQATMWVARRPTTTVFTVQLSEEWPQKKRAKQKVAERALDAAGLSGRDLLDVSRPEDMARTLVLTCENQEVQHETGQ